jgi:hypothetical protein
MTDQQIRAPDEACISESDALSRQDATRCKKVEDALYRRACGYKVRLKKSFKLKRVDYDPDTGKKVTEKEVLEPGFEEVHIPADVRVCAYYLNNRDPARWSEHPREEGEEALCGVVDYPPLAEPTCPPAKDDPPDRGGGEA